MEYYNYIERPELDAFGIDYSPRNGLGNVITTFWFEVTGESGAHYNLIRAIGMPRKDLVLNFGLFKGSGDVNKRADHLIGPKELPVTEPFWMERRADAVVYGGPSFEIAMYDDRYEWRDAGERIQLTAQRLGQACSVYIPPQPGFEQGFLDRSHLCFVTGTIDGEPVRGMFMDDHLYSRPGLRLEEAGLVQKFENYWTQWFVEYEDGSVEGGSAWRGQPGTGFSHAHYYSDGRSRARRDARIEVARNSHTSMEHMTLSLGDEVTFEFEQLGSYDWPFHTYGRVSSCTRDKKIVNSWHYIENWPVNMSAVEEFQAAYARLYGRPASLRRIVEGARIENEALVLLPQDVSTGGGTSIGGSNV